MKKKKSRLHLHYGTSQKTRTRQRLKLVAASSLFLSVVIFGIAFIYSNLGSSKKTYAIAINYSWVGSISTDWNNNLNWLPLGIPGSGDNVTIGVALSNNPVLSTTTSVNNLTINNNGILNLNGFPLTAAGTTTTNSGGTIDIKGSTLTLNGNAAFNGGTLSNTGTGGSVTALGTTTTFGNATGGPTVNTDISATSATITFRNTTFNSTTTLEKNAGGNDASIGNNTFNGTTIIKNSSTSGYFLLANTTKDIFNGDVTFTNTQTNIIYPAYSDVTGTQFNGNITLNNTSTGSIRFCQNTGKATLATGKTIAIGSGGYAAGLLYIKNFTQAGSAAQSMSVTSGTAALYLQSGSTFNGNVSFIFPQLYLNGTTFAGTAYFEKNGATTNNSTGGNIFNGVTSFVNSSSAQFLLGNGTADLFNSDVTFNNTGNSTLYLAYNGVGNQFNGNVTLNNTGGAASAMYLNNTGSTTYNGNIVMNCTSGTGIYFGSSTGTAVLAIDKTLSIGSAGFSSGILQLRNFTQTGTAAQSFPLTGTTTIKFGPASNFGGDVTSTSAALFLNGCTFGGNATFLKTGTTNDQSTGNNTFNDTTSFTNTGSGYIMLSQTTRDIFNSDVSFTNTGTGLIHAAYNDATGTQFNGNITVNSTAGTGIQFGAGTGTSTLAAGKTISIGSVGFSSGTLLLRNFTQPGATAHSFPLTGTAGITFGPGSSFGGDVTSTSSALSLNGCTFSGTTNFTKTGSTTENSIGGNTFSGVSTFTNSGNGVLLMGNTNPDIFNADATFNNTGTNHIYLANASAGNQFNGNVTLNNIGSGTNNYILVGDGTAASTTVFNGNVTANNTGTATNGLIRFNMRGTSAFNGNIIVNSTAGTSNSYGVYFSYPGYAGSATLAATKTVTIGSSGFSKGTLYFGNFTQLGTFDHSFPLTGTSVMTFGSGSTFNGNVTSTSAGLFFNGTIFNGTVTATKNGTTNDQSTGNNTFNGVTSITDNGTGYILLSSTTRDIFNSDVTFTNTGTSLIYAGYNDATGTQFNGNIVVNSTAGTGIQFGANTGTVSLATAKTISIGSQGFSSGTLAMRNFTQSGNGSQALALTGTSTVTLGPNSTFNGSVNFTAPQLLLHGTTFNDVATLEKTGASNNNGNGGNTFNGVTLLKNSGSGTLLTALTTGDTYNADVTFTNTGTSYIRVAYVGTSAFNGNVLLNSTSGTGVAFCESTGIATLSSTKTVSIGSSGFSSGTLIMRDFVQVGSNPISFNLSGTATIQFGPAATINGDVTVTGAAVLLNGCTFNGNATFTKTGSTSDQGTGNNTFNGTTSFTNNGTGYLMLAQTTRDIFNGDVTFTNTNSSIIYPGYNDASNSTQFNGNIFVTNTGTGSIRFGQNTGSVTLASGKTISIGASGFASGDLYLRKFTQTGNTAQTINLTSGTAALYLQTGSVFNGNVNFTLPQIYLNGSTFNGTTTIEKSGATNNTGTGPNVFNGVTTIKNSGTGILYLANTTADDFNNNVTFIQTGTGVLYPAYSTNSTFAGDISTTGTAAAITFGSSTGTVTLDGSSPQNISGSTSFPPVIRRLAMNNGTNGLTLNVPVTVNSTLTLTNGNITTSSVNLLTLATSVTVSGVSDASFINGPVRKVGNQAFTFPVGKNNSYRPISISAPAAAADHFTAEYFNADPITNYNTASHDPTLDHMSRCEYWALNRTNGASNVNVTMSWNTPASCGVNILADMRVGRWDAVLLKWKDLGNGGTTGNATTGTVVTTSPSTSFGTFAHGSSSSGNSLPITLSAFDVQLVEEIANVTWTTASEINNDYFTIQRSGDGLVYDDIGKVRGAGTTTTEHSYSLDDPAPLKGTSFYRLKQTDYDGHFKIFDPVSLDYKGSNMEYRVISVGPNPFSSSIKVDYYCPADASLTFILTRLDGSVAFTDRVSASPGVGVYSAEQLSDFSAGVYILKVLREEDVLDTRKLVKH